MTPVGSMFPLDGETPPTFGLSNFDSRPLFPSHLWVTSAGAQSTWTDIWFTNHILQAVVGAALVIGFWLWMARGLKVVPGRKQYVGEAAYNLVRNGIAREVIGTNFQRYTPYLVALISFIVVNNLFGETFLFMFPTFSKIGFVWALAISTFVLYNAAGIRNQYRKITAARAAANKPAGSPIAHGLLAFGHYFIKMTVPPGVPKPLLILIGPLEFLSNFITRPVTLCLRLFANLLAGHLILGVFILGGTYLMIYSHNTVYHVAGGLSMVIAFAMFALEIFVACLQAYVFTVLTAQYVSSALSEEH